MTKTTENKEESVEDLLKKLAKKGKKVKLLDETASVKELPKQEDVQDGDIDEEPDLDRGDPIDQMHDSIDDIAEEPAAPSSVKKKFKKIKEERPDDEEDEDDEPQIGQQKANKSKNPNMFVEDPDIASAEKLME